MKNFLSDSITWFQVQSISISKIMGKICKNSTKIYKMPSLTWIDWQNSSCQSHVADINAAGDAKRLLLGALHSKHSQRLFLIRHLLVDTVRRAPHIPRRRRDRFDRRSQNHLQRHSISAKTLLLHGTTHGLCGHEPQWCANLLHRIDHLPIVLAPDSDQNAQHFQLRKRHQVQVSRLLDYVICKLPYANIILHGFSWRNSKVYHFRFRHYWLDKSPLFNC